MGEERRIAPNASGAAATGALIQALQDSPEEVQVRVAEALARRGATEDIPALMEIGRNSENRRMGFACLKALGTFGVPPHRVFTRRPSFAPEERIQYVEAALDAAYRLRIEGKYDDATEIYKNVTAYSNEPAHLRESILGLEAANSDAFAAQALGYLFQPGVSKAAYRALAGRTRTARRKTTPGLEKSDPGAQSSTAAHSASAKRGVPPPPSRDCTHGRIPRGAGNRNGIVRRAALPRGHHDRGPDRLGVDPARRP